MFKITLSVALTSVLLAGCAPDLLELQQPFPEGVWDITVSTDEELDEVYTNGGLLIAEGLNFTTFTANDAGDCFVKWARVMTNSAFTNSTEGEEFRFHSNNDDAELALHVTKVGSSSAWKYMEAEFVINSTPEAVQAFELTQTICE